MLRLVRNLCVALVGLVLVLCLFNLALGAVFSLRDQYFPSPQEKEQQQSFGKVYPGMSKDELQTFLAETHSRPFVYVPFLQHKERPYQGTYYNVSVHGTRKTKGSGPWPPAKEDFNIFQIGGSTTFGFGVPDEETIPSHLQQMLKGDSFGRPVHVYNFGQGNYYSTQERILFEDLLISGNVPDVVIFIDGLNDFYSYDSPKFTSFLREAIEHGDSRPIFSKWWYRLPLSRGIRFVTRRFTAGRQGVLGPPPNHEEVIAKVIRRYLSNKKWIEMLCKQYAIEPVFVWQPIVTYKYDSQYHLSAGVERRYAPYVTEGYRLMEDLAKKEDLGSNFLWCADIQEDLKKPLYIDDYHYSGEMNELLARIIYDSLKERRLLP